MTSAFKTARFLSPNWISDLVWDSKSYEKGAPNNRSSEDAEGFQDELGVSHLQPDCPTSRGQVSSSSFSSSASDEEEVFQSVPGEQVQTPSISQWTWPFGPQRSVVHTFSGDCRERKGNEAPYINDSSSPLKSFPTVFCGNYHTTGDRH